MTLGSLMAAVALLSLGFAILRPFTKPAAVRAAEEILREYGPLTEARFDVRHYRAAEVQLTPSGYWKVRFTRVAGRGEPERIVSVSEGLVQKKRFGHFELW